MSSRLLPLLGPALVLYLVADVAAAAGGLDLTGGLVAAAALLASLAPIAVRGRADHSGARRVGWLGVLSGIALVVAIHPGVLSIVVDAAVAVAMSFGGALALDLALTTPDRPRALARGGLRAVPWIGAVVAAGLGLWAVLPPLSLGEDLGGAWLLPPVWTVAPAVFAWVACLGALILRVARRKLGSAPEALAAGSWAQLGLWPAVLVGGAAVVMLGLGALDRTAPWARGLGAAAVLAVIAGHLFMLDAERRLAAGRATRRAVATALTLAIAAAALAPLREHLPHEPLTFGLCAAVGLLVVLGIYRVIAPIVSRVLAPFGGRLLAAVDDALAAVGTVTRVDDLARVLLAPLRRASGSLDADPLLFVLSPGSEARIDAAGEPHVKRRELPESLVARLRDRRGEVIVRDALESSVVRRPEQRALVETLVLLDALCVMPLVADGEVEGAILVPRGRRRSGLSLEEITALEKLASRVAGMIAVLGAGARAQDRASTALQAHDRVEDRIEDLEAELERLRSDARVLKAGAAADRIHAPPIAYSAAMRALAKRVDDVGPVDTPVLIVAEGGTFVDQIGQLVHQASGRSGGAFVVADCGAVRPERSEAALFGEEGGDAGAHPGWLRLATGGSLLLVDVPALSPMAQRALAEAVAARQAHPVGGAGTYPLDARIIATSRLDLDPLVDAGAFDPELGRWLSPLRVEVPPLRERREDLPSLVLLALDRACRVVGRPVVGIEPEALEVLLMHDWPGNLRELQSVIDRAVARTEGSKVSRKDLPPLPRGMATAEGVERDDDPLVGTYTALEKRILERALERAAGNKSEAARLLGLKRTTFLDKLRRHRIDDAA